MTLNNLYEKLGRYMKAAKIIFEENEEMLKWFKFPVSNKVKDDGSPELETQESHS